MKAIRIESTKDVLNIGSDIKIEDLKDLDVIVWCNRGMYRVISKSRIENIRSLAIDIGPGTNQKSLPNKEALRFTWGQAMDVSPGVAEAILSGEYTSDKFAKLRPKHPSHKRTPQKHPRKLR